MNAALLVWGIILLVGLGWASPALLAQGMFTEAQLWMGWAVVFLIGFWAVGKTMKMPKDAARVWLHTTVFGLVATFAVALGYVAAPLVSLMALWFILIGAALWKGGPKGAPAAGVILALVGVALPTWFVANYWMAGALFLGLGPIIHTLLEKV